MTWVLLALLVATNLFWLLVAAAAGHKIQSLTARLSDAEALKEAALGHCADLMRATDDAVCRALCHLPSSRGH